MEAKSTVFKRVLNGHSTKLLNNLCKQWQTEDNCDLVIYSESGAFTVHSCVMCAFSIRIASLISQCKTQGNSPTYSVNVSFSYEALESIVKALYTGIFEFEQSCFSEIVAAVKWLKISYLHKSIKKLPRKNPKVSENLSLATNSKAGRRTSFLACETTSSRLQPSVFEEVGEVELDNDIPSSNFTTPVDVDTQSSSLTELTNIDLSSKSLVVKLHRIDDCFRQEKALMKEQIGTNNSVVNSTNSDTNTEEDNDIDEVYMIPDSLDMPADITNTLEHSPQKTAADSKTIASRKRQFVTSASSSKNNGSHSKNNGNPSKNNINPSEENINPSKKNASPSEENTSPSDTKEDACPSNLKDKSLSPLTEAQSAREQQPVPKKRRQPKKQRLDVVETEKSLMWKQARPQNEDKVPGNPDLDTSVTEEVAADDHEKISLDLLTGNMKYVHCKKCNWKFKDAEKYQEHVKKTHFDCPDCFFSSVCKTVFTKHKQKFHTGIHYLNCSECEFVGSTQRILREHSKEAHGLDKPFKCDYEGCNYSCTVHARLREHKLTHDKQFMCDKCSSTYSCRLQLKYHQGSCYDMGEYLCDLCGQSFNHKRSMIIHRQTVHFGEKPHQCKICLVKFAHRSNLYRHIRIHNNLFPYSCHICEEKFRHSNSLKYHVASKHKGLPKDFELSILPPGNKKLGGMSYKRLVKTNGNNTVILGTKRGPNLVKKVKGSKRCGASRGTSTCTTSSTLPMISTSSVHEDTTTSDCNFNSNNSSDHELSTATSNMS